MLLSQGINPVPTKTVRHYSKACAKPKLFRPLSGKKLQVSETQITPRNQGLNAGLEIF